jgi:hypothetical protein
VRATRRPAATRQLIGTPETTELMRDAEHFSEKPIMAPAGDWRLEYEPTYVLRVLKSLHLEFDPL